MPPTGRALTALVLAVALALAVPARDASARGRPAALRPAAYTPRSGAPRLAARARQGRVEFVTQRRVYLDRGGADGLGRHQAVQLLRNGRLIGRCTIEVLSDHAATCHSARARIGDVFRLARPTAARTAAARPLPAPDDDQALQARAEAMAAAPIEKVDYKGPSSASLPAGITIAGGVTAWSSYPAAGSSYVAEELEVRLHRLPLGQTDLRLDAALTAVRWQTFMLQRRFRPDAPTQIYLWEAEVSRRELDDRTVFAVGRLWPWHVPGVPMLDGIQIGRRDEDGTVEWGAYGGLIPADLTLVPTFDAWAGGLYSALMRTGRAGDPLRLARGEARLGVRESPTIGLVNEAEGLAEVALPSVAVDGGARLRYASQVDRQITLERLFFDLRAPALPSGGGWLQLRYTGATPEQQPALTAELPALKGGYHALFDLYSTYNRSLRFALFGSGHIDRDSGLREGEAGLELGLPRLLGDYGGLAFGAAIGEGWLETRGAYAQVMAFPLSRIRIRGRVSGTRTQFTTGDPMTDIFEVGADLQIDAALNERLRVRVRELARIPVLIQGLLPTGQLPGVMSSVDIVVAL